MQQTHCTILQNTVI